MTPLGHGCAILGPLELTRDRELISRTRPRTRGARGCREPMGRGAGFLPLNSKPIQSRAQHEVVNVFTNELHLHREPQASSDTGTQPGSQESTKAGASPSAPGAPHPRPKPGISGRLCALGCTTHSPHGRRTAGVQQERQGCPQHNCLQRRKGNGPLSKTQKIG